MKYPQWFIKRHMHRIENAMCKSKWVEVWAFINSDDTYICPIGVCPKCFEIVEIDEELDKYMEKKDGDKNTS